jgi:hypothetical protein
MRDQGDQQQSASEHNRPGGPEHKPGSTRQQRLGHDRRERDHGQSSGGPEG